MKSQRLYPLLTDAPRETGNLLNAGSTKYVGFQRGRTKGHHTRHKTRATGYRLRASSHLFPGVDQAPRVTALTWVWRSNSGSTNQNRAVFFSPRPKASKKKKKKSVIPEQIPFLPGLSAPSDSLPITTPFSMPHLSPHLKKKKVTYSLSLCFP